jgi:hypothetical protein
MPNHNISKPIQDNDESSNEPGRRRQRSSSRINLNREEQDRSRQVPTIIDVAGRGGGVYPNTYTPNRQLPGTTMPYRPMDISSILRLSSTMRNRSGSSMYASTTTTVSVPTLNREGFIHILDCALAICDEILDDRNTVDDESDCP